MTEKYDPQELTQTIADARGAPLLVLYWPDHGAIAATDVRELRIFLKSQGLSREQKSAHMDVLVETYGGAVNVPYLIGQMLHDYADEIAFLVPNKAQSGGTEICLAGNLIIFGEDATLSPIDIQVTDTEGNRWSDTAIDNYRELADGAEHDATRSAIIDATIGLLPPQLIAEVYRLSRMEAQHARALLHEYMFKDAEADQVEQVLQWLTKLAPSHDWEIDYHLARDIGLKVQRMDEDLSDYMKLLVDTLAHEVSTDERLDQKSQNALYLLYAAPSNEEYDEEDGAESGDERDVAYPAEFAEDQIEGYSE